MDTEDVPFQAIFEASLNAISVHSQVVPAPGETPDFRFDAVNPAFETMTGLKSALVVGRTFSQVFPCLSPAWLERYQRVVDTGEPVSFEDWSQALDRWYQVSAFRHKAHGFTVTFVDITDRKVEHQKLLEEEAKYRAFFDLPNAVKFVVDGETRTIIEANPKAVAFYGWPLEVLKTMTIDQINLAPQDQILEAFTQALDQTKTEFQFRHRLRSGEIRHVQVYTSPGVWRGRPAIFSIVHDVTETKRIQMRLLQGERLSAVGQMTTSLYHELGNLLGTLSAQTQLMELEIPEGPTKDRLIERLHRQFRRAKNLVDSVKRFSRDQEIQLAPCRLSRLMEDLVELESIPCRQSDIRLTFEPCDRDQVAIDTALVQQVFLNLFKNAVEAIRGGGIHPGAWIAVTVAAEGDEVVVRVSNNGPPVPPEVRGRLFTPFFTTKKGGETEGTGLGLSFSASIIRNHGGVLFLEDGPGTVFQVRLPLQPTQG